MIADQISVEIKALTQLENVHLAQAINYLEAYNLEIGLLINFGETKLKFHRIENKKFKQSSMNSEESNTSQFQTFDNQGGRGKMFQLFGNEMNEMINELNEVLTA